MEPGTLWLSLHLHQRVSFASIIARNVIKKKKKTCKIHEEQAKLYCFDCNSLICRDCIVFDHKSHKCEFVKTASASVRKKLQEGLASLRFLQTNAHDVAKKVKETKVKIGEQGEMAAVTIQQSFQLLHKVLDEHEQGLLSKVSTAVEMKTKHLSRHEESIEVFCTQIQSLLDFVERILLTQQKKSW